MGGDFINGSNSQNVDPKGFGKKSRPNRRRHGANHRSKEAGNANEPMEERLNKSVSHFILTNIRIKITSLNVKKHISLNV